VNKSSLFPQLFLTNQIHNCDCPFTAFVQSVSNIHQFDHFYFMAAGLCGVIVEHLLAIQKDAGSNLDQSTSRQQPWESC